MTTAAAAAVKAISKGEGGRKEGGEVSDDIKNCPGGENGGTKASSDYLGYQGPKEDPRG